jgi:hypothetical protein
MRKGFDTLAAFFPPPHHLFPITLFPRIAPPNAFLHDRAPEAHPAKPTSADATQVAIPHKTH